MKISEKNIKPGMEKFQKKSTKLFSITPLTEWCSGNLKKPLIISGPCSAESERQVIDTAKAIAKIGKVSIFRAGVWKPRTDPNSFSGVGEIGLRWLKLVKQETSLLVATEAANAKHVELCLKYGIDILWIGARSTANPFVVQEIADALKGVDIPVLIKNPINPDLAMWIGAIERINNSGIKKILAVHRGFSTFEKTLFRYIPRWEIPIELQTLYPNLEIICDPSHIAGNTEMVPLISQKALDLNMVGLMIECHIKPSNALSDARQQLTPKGLAEILDNLIIRNSKEKNVELKNKLDNFRVLIDELDQNIIHQIAARMELVEKIGEYKKVNNITILQPRRWNKLLKNRLSLGASQGINKEFLKNLFNLIHEESINIQSSIMNRLARLGK